jgi:predicted metal-dependent peptidase
MEPDELRQLEEDIKSNVLAAAEFAKSRGNMPGGLEGLIKAVGAPIVNWKAYIQEFVKGSRPDNYTWARANRKMLVNHGVYMPRIQLQGAGIGVLSIDTSGSVSDDELRSFVKEIIGMIELCNPDRLYIIQHDAIVQKVDEWEAGMDFDGLKIKGRGGTCIQPVFRKLEDIDDEINWMIVFSDMEIGDWPTPANWPDYPVLLCGTGRDTSPKGCGATYIPLKPAI